MSEKTQKISVIAKRKKSDNMRYRKNYKVFEMRCNRCQHRMLLLVRTDGLAYTEYIIDVIQKCNCDNAEIKNQIKDTFSNLREFYKLAAADEKDDICLTHINIPVKYDSESLL